MRLIDADVLDEVLDEFESLKAHAAFTEGIMIARRELAHQPTIDAEPVRHGRWMKLVYDAAWTKCSECGCNWEWEMVKNCNMDYCPNCGAKMDLEVQDAKERPDP